MQVMTKEKIMKISEEIISQMEEEKLPIKEKIIYIKALCELYKAILKFLKIDKLKEEPITDTLNLADIQLIDSEISILEDFIKLKKSKMKMEE